MTRRDMIDGAAHNQLGQAVPGGPKVLNGYYLEDLDVGMKAVFGKTITEADILMFAGVSGDTNPVHLDEEFAAATPFGGRIAHGMLTASLISTVLGTKLPGPGSIYLSQSMRFWPRSAPARPSAPRPRSRRSTGSAAGHLRHGLHGRRQERARGRGRADGGATPGGRGWRLTT
jgi:hypothetical protein